MKQMGAKGRKPMKMEERGRKGKQKIVRELKGIQGERRVGREKETLPSRELEERLTYNKFENLCIFILRFKKDLLPDNWILAPTHYIIKT